MSRHDPQGLGYDPAVLRVLLDAYRRYLPVLEEMRRDSGDVAELLAIAALVDEFHAKIISCQRRLDRVETQRFTEARREAASTSPEHMAHIAVASAGAHS